MKATHSENQTEVAFEHTNPVKAFAYLWAKENALLTAVAICEQMASKIESEVEQSIEEGAVGLSFGKWHIPYHTLH